MNFRFVAGFFVCLVLTLGLVSAVQVDFSSDGEVTKTLEFEGVNYVVSFISGTDDSATIRVATSNSDSDTETIEEGSSEEVGGLDVKVLEAEEEVLVISTSLEIILSEDSNDLIGFDDDSDDDLGDESDDDSDEMKSGQEGTESNSDSDVCNGCVVGDDCYPVAYRTGSQFCSADGLFYDLLGDSVSCNNNFECESNLCVSGECVSQSLLQKILGWFRRVFG